MFIDYLTIMMVAVVVGRCWLHGMGGAFSMLPLNSCGPGVGVSWRPDCSSRYQTSI